MKKILIIIIIIAITIIAIALVVFIKKPTLFTQFFSQEIGNESINIPEANPFKTETNPFSNSYKNPFSNQ